MAIQFVFTDWSAARSFESSYPSSRTLEYRLPLKSVAETDQYVRQRLRDIKTYLNAPDEQIPECSDEDLWRTKPVWKYYKKPGAKRATKNYDNPAEAHTRQITEGGEVKEVKGQVKACKYCEAFPVCAQKDRLIASGDLILSN